MRRRRRWKGCELGVRPRFASGSDAAIRLLEPRESLLDLRNGGIVDAGGEQSALIKSKASGRSSATHFFTSIVGFAMMKPFTGNSGVNDTTPSQLLSVILMCPGPTEP